MDAAGLRQRQLTFFTGRLVSERAEVEWEVHVRDAIATLLDAKVAAALAPDALLAAIEAATTTESFARMIGPISKAINAELLADMRARASRVGDYVPATARATIDQLLERPGLMQEALIRRILEQEAMEETMRDVLFDALKEFNERVNPFVADWGLPGIMKKLGPFGFGPLAKSVENLRAEFDRRLEPEMRKFLQTFSRKALTRTGDLLTKNSDSPNFISLRKSIVSWVYEQQVRQLLAGVDEPTSTLAQQAMLEIAEHTAGLASVRVDRRRAITAFVSSHGDQTLRELLASFGAEAALDSQAIAAATWPAVRAVLGSEAVRAWIDAVLGEFWEAQDENDAPVG